MIRRVSTDAAAELAGTREQSAAELAATKEQWESELAATNAEAAAARAHAETAIWEREMEILRLRGLVDAATVELAKAPPMKRRPTSPVLSSRAQTGIPGVRAMGTAATTVIGLQHGLQAAFPDAGALHLGDPDDDEYEIGNP